MTTLLAFLPSLILCLFAPKTFAFDWRTADRSSIGIAPLPENERAAIVQVYAARTVRWRKYVAVHSWIATKEENAQQYIVYQVIGWRLRQGLGVVSVEPGAPDGRWYGHPPELLFELRGPLAAQAIPKIQAAAHSYPYPKEYRAWPGPNSNTFVSYLIRKTPEIGVELPPHAIGKDWIEDGRLLGKSETGTGVQLSVFGALGMTLGLAEGIELNLLGMSFGIDFLRPALKLPFIGRLGLRDTAILTAKLEGPAANESPSQPDQPLELKTVD